jgi:hypothetical protein
VLWQAALLGGGILELVWLVTAIASGVVLAKTVKLYTNL